MTEFLEYKFIDNSGREVEMSRFAGKDILIVNTASLCGFTQQYEGLEALYRQHSNNLEIIAFPCNQFGNQEPNTNIKIKEFCKQFDITFTLAAKIDVNGEKEHL
jgi:glutathione peroxidase